MISYIHHSMNNCLGRLRLYTLSYMAFSKQAAGKQPENKLLKYMQNKIKATGPITVAQYMKEVLTNPCSGYYMHKDSFGSSGDFITSPEISQIFGELIAVWFYNEWCRLEQPSPLQLVELGPGRGTLADDILRVFRKLNMSKSFQVHLVEVSPYLRQVQKNTLCGLHANRTDSHADFENNGRTESCIPDQQIVESKYGVSVAWHSDLSTVPKAFSLILAHEFFDALPVHKLKKYDGEWREILIGLDARNEEALQFVLSRNPTPASKLYIDLDEIREELEVSPEAGVIVSTIAGRLEENGGISLIVDYGYTNREKCDTFRGFRQHKLHDPLADPGTADLTADVDFTYLIKCTKNKAVSVGPVSQAAFLKGMSIDIRLEKLLQNASSEQKASLVSGYHMLTDPDQMGERYKVLALYPEVLKEFLEKFPPPGF